MGMYELLGSVKEFAKEYYPIVALTVTFFGIFFGARGGLFQIMWSKIKDFWRTDIRELKKCNLELKNCNLEFEQKLKRVRDAFDDDNNLWLRNPVVKPERYDAKLQASIPILLVANLKGGVGKTTIAANLATYFERCKGERVLAIDLDHQGSLSSMLLPETAQRIQRPADAVKALIGGRANGATGLFSERIQIRHSQRDSRLIECDDAFGNFETRLVLEWLIGDCKDDIRYNLARVLHS